jgi:hypothetical protein
VDLKPGKSSAVSENFTISFAPRGNGSTMTLAWGDQAWSTDITPAK